MKLGTVGHLRAEPTDSIVPNCNAMHWNKNTVGGRAACNYCFCQPYESAALPLEPFVGLILFWISLPLQDIDFVCGVAAVCVGETFTHSRRCRFKPLIVLVASLLFVCANVG